MAAFLLAGPASASTCGTVVVPVGIGLSDPDTVNSLHPILSPPSAYGQQLFRMLYWPLIWVGSTHQIDWTESLASAITIADGGATFRLTIKPDLWSDGVPVTADDIVYSWEMIRALGPAFGNFGTGGLPQLVRDITADGPHGLRIRLTRPVNTEWFELSGMPLLYALPRHAWGRYSITQQQSLQTDDHFFSVVDGPFKLEHLAIGRNASFLPNPLYAGHHPELRRLVVTFLAGGDPLSALEAGQIDMANLPFTVWNAAHALTGFNDIPVGAGAAYDVIIPNLANARIPFLADVRIRRAIEQGIDQKRIIDAVFHGNSEPDYGFVPLSLTSLLSPRMRDGTSPLAFDRAAAARALDAAGWRPGADGVRVHDGMRLAFDVLTTAGLPLGLEMLQLIKDDLTHIGIDMRIKEVQFNQIIARMVGPSDGWDAAFISWSIDGYPDGTQLFKSGSSSNFEHYASPEMDRMLDDATLAQGRDGLYALEDYVSAQQPMIFLPAGFYSVLVRPGIEGVNDFVGPSGAWTPEYLRLTGPMACH